MHASDLDIDVSCPACGGTGDAIDDDRRAQCPVCEGTATYNRLTDMPSGEVHVGPVEYYQQGPLIKVERHYRMPVEDDVEGGFNGRFGTFVPSNPDPNYEQDMLDQLNNNPLGANTNASDEYEMPDEFPYDGAVFGAGAFPGGAWPGGPDLSADQVLAWIRARGDTPTADELETTFTQVGLV